MAAVSSCASFYGLETAAFLRRSSTCALKGLPVTSTVTWASKAFLLNRVGPVRVLSDFEFHDPLRAESDHVHVPRFKHWKRGRIRARSFKTS